MCLDRNPNPRRLVVCQGPLKYFLAQANPGGYVVMIGQATKIGDCSSISNPQKNDFRATDGNRAWKLLITSETH